MRKRATVLVAGAVAVPLALFACGSDELSSRTSSTSTGFGAFGETSGSGGG